MKIKGLLSTLTVLVTFIICIPFGASAASTLKGDANGDGKISIKDAAYIARCLVSRQELDDIADYNGDGKVTIRDAATIASDLAKRITPQQREALDLVNQERAKNGAAPLKINSTLNKMAYERAMESAEQFSHTRLTGESFYTIFDEYNIDYSYCGENLAAGSADAEGTVNQWVNSPSHYENMLNPEYTEIGIGYYYDETTVSKYHWVQLFMVD